MIPFFTPFILHDLEIWLDSNIKKHYFVAAIQQKLFYAKQYTSLTN